jgi:hypothetical protein
VVKKLFRPIPPAQYTSAEIFFASVPGVIFLILPQYWLFKSGKAFIIFWTLMALAVITIKIGVCPTCENVHCFSCRSRKMENKPG